jgi:hypothetical protein
MQNLRFIIYFLLVWMRCVTSWEWLKDEVIQNAITKAEEMKNYHSMQGQPLALDTLPPFISAGAFQTMCGKYVCEKKSNCIMLDADIPRVSGSCIFVEPYCLSHFLHNYMKKIKVYFALVVHNGASQMLSTRTGASKRSLVYPDANLLPALKEAYYRGYLIGYHGQSLWWPGYERGVQRPAFLHCLPRGIHTSKNIKFNGNSEKGTKITNGMSFSAHDYVGALKALLQYRASDEYQRQQIDQNYKNKALLLLDESMESELPGMIINDHAPLDKVFSSINGKYRFNVTRSVTHNDWLMAIAKHRFTLIPNIRAYEARLMDVFLMGGVPIVRRGSASTCFDDTDNQVNLTSTRGSLPIVQVDNWKQVTIEYLEDQWSMIIQKPLKKWDSSRLWFDHWANRVKYINAPFDINAMGVDKDGNPDTSRLPDHLFLHNEIPRGKYGK